MSVALTIAVVAVALWVIDLGFTLIAAGLGG